MPTTGKSLRVLIVEDNRDGADALGLLVEALGHQVHVTYGGLQALSVATAFRPDLIFAVHTFSNVVCSLATREIPVILSDHLNMSAWLKRARFGGLTARMMRRAYRGQAMSNNQHCAALANGTHIGHDCML